MASKAKELYNQAMAKKKNAATSGATQGASATKYTQAYQKAIQKAASKGDTAAQTTAKATQAARQSTPQQKLSKARTLYDQAMQRAQQSTGAVSRSDAKVSLSNPTTIAAQRYNQTMITGGSGEQEQKSTLNSWANRYNQWYNSAADDFGGNLAGRINGAKGANSLLTGYTSGDNPVNMAVSPNGNQETKNASANLSDVYMKSGLSDYMPQYTEKEEAAQKKLDALEKQRNEYLKSLKGSVGKTVSATPTAEEFFSALKKESQTAQPAMRKETQTAFDAHANATLNQPAEKRVKELNKTEIPQAKREVQYEQKRQETDVVSRVYNGSGIKSADQRAMVQAKRDELQQELDQLNSEETVAEYQAKQKEMEKAFDLKYGSYTPDFMERSNELTAQIDEMYSQLSDQIQTLTMQIASLDNAMTLYDRVDKYDIEQTQKNKGQDGFATAQADWAAGEYGTGNRQPVSRSEAETRREELENAIENIPDDAPDYWEQYDQLYAQLEALDAQEDAQNSEEEAWKTADNLSKYLQMRKDSYVQGPVSDAEEWAQFVSNYGDGAKEADKAGTGKHWEVMTDDEINAYYYLANTEGIQAANEYLEGLQYTLDRRYTMEAERTIGEAMDELPAAVNAAVGVATVPFNVLGAPVAFAGDVYSYMTTGEMNPYNNAHIIQNVSNAVRSEASSSIYSEIAGDGSNKVLNAAATITSNVYQAALSTLDSLFGMATMGNAYTITMGMGAASSRMRELVESGATDTEIAFGAAGSGILEALFEKVSIDRFTGNWINGNPEKFIKKMLMQSGTEASEEVFTEISNQIWDACVRGSKGDHQQRIFELLDEGLSMDEARQKAAAEDAMDVFWAGFGGLVSGGLSSVGGEIYQYGNNVEAGQEIAQAGQASEIIGEALDLYPSNKTAQKLQVKQDAGTLGNKKSDYAKLATMSQKIVNGIESGKAKIQHSVEDTAKELASNLFGEKAGIVENAHHNGQNWSSYLQEFKKFFQAGQDGTALDDAGEATTLTLKQKMQAWFMGNESVDQTTYEYDAQGSGQSYRTDSNDPVNIQGFAQDENGNLAVQTDEGETLSAESVKYGTYDDARLYHTVANMEVSADQANAILKEASKSSVSGAQYAVALNDAYQAGRSGVEFGNISQWSTATHLNENARKIAWEAGRTAQNAATASSQAAIDQGSHATATRGLTIEDSAKAIETLTDAQQTGLDTAKMLAAAGLNISVYASTEAERMSGTENGSIQLKDGTIRIDLNAGDSGQGAVAYAISHELSHFVQEISPKSFQNYQNVLFTELGGNNIDVDAIIQGKEIELRQSEEYANLTDDELRDLATSEAVAEMSETMLTDTDAAERVSQRLQQQDKSLWQKIKDYFSGLVERLKKAYKDMEPDSKIAQQTREVIARNEKILDAYVNAVADAVESYNNQNGQKNNAQEGVMFSQRKFDNMANQFADEIEEWYSGGSEMGRSFILGSTGEILQGLGAIESDIYINGDKISTILQDHPEITMQEIKQIPQILNDPILILKSKNVGRTAQNTRMMLFGAVKGTNGQPVMTVFDLRPSENNFIINDMQKVTSAYTKTTNPVNFVRNSDVMYLDKKRTTPLLRSIGFQMPIELLQSGFTGSITYKQRSVNLFGEKFSNVVSENVNQQNVRKSSRNLEAQNQKLKEDVAYLKKLVKIQKQGNKDFTLDRDWVKRQARQLMKDNNAKGDSTELARMLDGVYRYIWTSNDLSLDGMMNAAEEAAQWVYDHRVDTPDAYAQEVLGFLKGRRVALNEAQVEEAKYQFGNLNAFRSAVKGSIILDSKAQTTLDQLWQEAASEYPGTFDSTVNDGDMPGMLADIVNTMQNSRSEESQQAEYSGDEYIQSIAYSIIRSSEAANENKAVSTADTYKEKITKIQEANKRALIEYQTNRDAEMIGARAQYEAELSYIKQAHEQEMKELKAIYGESAVYQQEFIDHIEFVESNGKKSISDLRKEFLKYAKEKSGENQSAYEARLHEYQWMIDQYQSNWDYANVEQRLKERREAAKAKVESARATEMRNRIGDVTKMLNRYLLNPSKTLYVPDSLQPSVTAAMQAFTTMRLNDRATGEKVRSSLQQLQNAYSNLIEMNDGHFSQVYNEKIQELISDAIDTVSGTAYGNLNKSQLETIYNVFRAILQTVRNENKLFAKNLKDGYQQTGKTVLQELQVQKDRKAYANEGLEQVTNMLNKFGWNNLKPVYAFERMGSITAMTLYQNLRSGEDQWFRDVNAARTYAMETMSKYGYQDWDGSETVTIQAASGEEVALSLGERMSLYALAQREQALDHLTNGGFNLVQTVRSVKGDKRTEVFRDTYAHNLTADDVAAILDSRNLLQLSDQQKKFANEMRDYLSTVCAEQNNEISRALYGISLAKEINYFPLKSSGRFSDKVRASQEYKGNRQKNAGHMKATVKHASNVVELGDFMEIWADHVNDTAMYHSFALPMEDFYRVYNWRSGGGENSQTVSVRQMLEQKHGSGATAYVDKFLEDLNGGVRNDPTASIANSLLTGFKRGAVSASLSVAIQQPSAIGRALAVIDPKYFVGSKVESVKGINNTWAEMQKWAPVTGLKDIGRFDMNMGYSTRDLLTGEAEKKSLKNAIDKASGALPEFMDKITWVQIWEAAKRQTKAQNQNLRGDALLEKSGELFTKCITETQVYDSVFSRSGNMRSNDAGMKMATAFMAEPTTTANMAMSAIRDFTMGYKGRGTKKLASIAFATTLNGLLASIVYAARDDDEEKTFLEKYLKSFTSELIDGLNPLGYVPIAKDVWSIAQGYDVERADMSLISDLVNGIGKFHSSWKAYSNLDEYATDEERKAAIKKAGLASLDMVSYIANFYGIPLKNVVRDTKAAVNTVNTLTSDRKGDKATASRAMWEAWNEYLPSILRGDSGKTAEVYTAVASRSEAWIDRVKARYDTDKKFQTAVVGALEKYDSRIKAAAKAQAGGDSASAEKIAAEIAGEGEFSREQVDKAVEKAIKKMPGYDYEEYLEAVVEGKDTTQIVQTLKNHGRTEDGILSQTKSNLKEWYIEEGRITQAQAEQKLQQYAGMTEKKAKETVQQWTCEKDTGTSFSDVQEEFLNGNLTAKEAVQLRVKYGGVSQTDAEATVQQWTCEKDTGIAYSELKDALMDGRITEKQLANYLVKYGGKDQDSAQETAAAYAWKKRNPGYDLTASQIKSYTQEITGLGKSAEATGIKPNTYVQYLEDKADCKGTDADGDGKTDSGSKKAEILKVINSLPITNEQKDALYYANGWAESKIYQAPWH